jgi:hypothetical protein
MRGQAMSLVIEAKRTEKGIIVHKLDNGEIREYRAIRGGISWPLMEKNLPGYCCIFGEEWVKWTPMPERCKLRLLSEYEAPDILTSLTTFFTRLTDDSKLYLCDTFYTVTNEFQGEDYSGYAEAFQEFIQKKQISGRLEEAPWADKPDLGLYQIREWMSKGLLELPEGSLVVAQLRMVESEKAKQVPQTLNAVNALRFVVSGFEKYRPTNFDSNWRSRVRQGTWRTG